MPAARRPLVVAQAALAAAERHNQEVATQLAVAQANEAKAAAMMAANAKATENTLDAVGNLARRATSRAASGPWAACRSPFGAVAGRLRHPDRDPGQITGCRTARCATWPPCAPRAAPSSSTSSAVRAQIADLKVQAERAVAAAGVARNAAARAKASLDALVARQAAAARVVEARKARERARMDGMQAESDRLQAVLAARARAAREQGRRREAAARARGRPPARVRPGPRPGRRLPQHARSAAPVSSEFGFRYHPVLHITGACTPASTSPPAAAPPCTPRPTVTSAMRRLERGGYGNRIVVDHGMDTRHRPGHDVQPPHLASSAAAGTSAAAS